MARDDLEYLSLVDFKPGIYSKYSLTVGTTIGTDGAARRELRTKQVTPGTVISDEYQTTFTHLADYSYAPLTYFTTHAWTHGLTLTPAPGRYWILFVGGNHLPADSNMSYETPGWHQGTGYWWNQAPPPKVDLCGYGDWVTCHLIQVDNAADHESGETEAPGLQAFTWLDNDTNPNGGSFTGAGFDPLAPTLVSLAFDPADGYAYDPAVFTPTPGDLHSVYRRTMPTTVVGYDSGFYGSDTYSGPDTSRTRGWIQHHTFSGPGIDAFTWTGGGLDDPTPPGVELTALQIVSIEGSTSADTVTENVVYTYGCYGDPDGGLRPLPRLKERFHRTINTTEESYTGPSFAEPDGEVAILDVNIVTPVLAYDGVDTGKDKYVDEATGKTGANFFTDARDSGNTLEQPDDLHILMYYTSSSDTALWPNNSNWAEVGGRPMTEWRQYRLHSRINANSGEIQDLSGGSENPYMERMLRRATIAVSPRSTPEVYPVPKLTSERYNQAWAGKAANFSTAGLYPSGSIAVGRTSDRLLNGYLTTVENGDKPGKVIVVATADHSHGWRAMPVVADDGTEALFPNLFGIYPNPLIDSLTTVFDAANPGPDNWNNEYGGNGREVFPYYRARKTELPTPYDVNDPSLYHQHRLDRNVAFAGRYLITHQDRFVGVITNTWLHSRAQDYGAFQFLDSNDVIAFSEQNAVIQLTDNLITPIAPVTTTKMVAPGGPNAGKYRAWSFWKIDQYVEADFTEANPGTPGSTEGSNKVVIWQDIYGNETPSGIGAMLSNGRDLFIVKNRGGGAIVSGSLTGGNVTQLPSIESTQHAIHHPVATPIGHLYGSRNGAFLYNGGDTSQRVSAQLDGFFWDHDHETGWGEKRHNALLGRFAYSYPFAYLPNGWVMDTRTGAWFRLNDPEESFNKFKYAFYVTNAFGDIYAVRSAFDITEQGRYPVDVYTARNGLAAQQYRWISQPLAKSINRTVQCEEVVLIAEGEGWVDVTLHGLDNTSDTTRFWVESNNQPVRLVANAYLRASEITVQIDVASAREASGPDIRVGNAPTIHAVHVGIRESHEEPRYE